MRGKALKRIMAGALSLAMIFSVNVLPFSADNAKAASDDVITITNHSELSDAIKNQKNGQTWNISAGTYVLDADDLAKYAGIQPSTSGQGGWYFPIYSQITIIGEGDVTITTDVEAPNGAWASQDFVSVWADGVTIDNVDFTCKKETNKAVEVMAKDFTLKNSVINPIDQGEGKVNSGSIYFNVADAGNATLENVEVHSWISANSATVTSGNINLVNTVVDFTDNAYAGVDGYGVISENNVFNANNGLTVKVDDNVDVQNQVLDRVPANSTISLEESIAVDEMFYILDTPGITIEGNGNTITASEDFKMGTHGQIQLAKVEADNVTIKNVNLVGTENTKHTLDVALSKNLVLENVTLDHYAAQTGAPLINNGSEIKIKGELNVITGENSWYGINVDNKNGDATIDFADASNVTFVDNRTEEAKNATPIVYAEIKANGNSSQTDASQAILNPENAGIAYDENSGFEQVFNVYLAKKNKKN